MTTIVIVTKKLYVLLEKRRKEKLVKKCYVISVLDFVSKIKSLKSVPTSSLNTKKTL